MFTVPSPAPHRMMSSTSYFKAWEAMLDESDRQARSYTDISQRYITSISQQLSELTSRKKHLMKKVREYLCVPAAGQLESLELVNYIRVTVSGAKD